MTFKTLLAAGSAAAAAAAFAGGAFAQAPAPAQTNAPQVSHGQPISGLCVVSVDAAIVNSSVGKNANQRLQQIAQQVQAELGGEQTAIENEDKQLSSQRATLDQNTFDQRAAALQVRANALQRKADLRRRELEATQMKVRQRLGQEVEPLLRQVYQSKQCSVLIDGNVVFANPAMDLTSQLVTALNAKITQFPIERERLDQAAPAAPAAAKK